MLFGKIMFLAVAAIPSGDAISAGLLGKWKAAKRGRNRASVHMDDSSDVDESVVEVRSRELAELSLKVVVELENLKSAVGNSFAWEEKTHLCQTDIQHRRNFQVWSDGCYQSYGLIHMAPWRRLNESVKELNTWVKEPAHSKRIRNYLHYSTFEQQVTNLTELNTNMGEYMVRDGFEPVRAHQLSLAENITNWANGYQIVAIYERPKLI